MSDTTAARIWIVVGLVLLSLLRSCVSEKHYGDDDVYEPPAPVYRGTD
jgi:hypothetical protein